MYGHQGEMAAVRNMPKETNMSKRGTKVSESNSCRLRGGFSVLRTVGNARLEMKMIQLSSWKSPKNQPLSTQTHALQTQKTLELISWFSVKGGYKGEICKNNTHSLHYISLKYNEKTSTLNNNKI